MNKTKTKHKKKFMKWTSGRVEEKKNMLSTLGIKLPSYP